MPRAPAGAGARGARVLVGATIGGLAAAGCDAHWARAALDDAPPAFSVWLATAGLTVPLSVALGVAVAVAVVVLHPTAEPSPRGFDRALRARGGEPTGAWLAALGPPAVAVWLVGAAHAAFVPLSSSAGSRGSGVVMALGLSLTGLGVAIVAAAAARAAAKRWPAERSPSLMGLAGVAVAAAIVAFGVATGDTSGTRGLAGILGVLKRPELDLRAPGLIVLMSAAAYLAPAALARLPALAAAAGALLPVGLVWHAAHSGLDQRRVANAIERSAPLAKRLVGPFRKLGDADGDGVSRLFGGGDCDDANAAVHPGAEDVPGNGVDEDCSGADDVAVSLATQPKEAPKDARAWVDENLPAKANVLLITVDTLRYDLGYMGYERNVSPNIDALAKRSVVFENAYSLASYTGKSIGPMLIGKYTSETHRGWSHFNTFGKEETFVQERARAAGVRTVSVQGHWYFKENTGLGRGFDVLDLSAAPKVLQLEGDRTVNSDKLTDAAIAQLSDPTNAGKQFFMWVHYLDPHAEYVKHDAFDFGAGNRERYDGEVAFTDHHIGRLLDFVAKQAFAARTAILLTSDHGEAFGEHGLIRHGFEIWEELVRVPLIVHVPGARPGRIPQRRGAVDVVPTILDVLRVSPPSGEGKDFVSGQSLLLDAMGPPGHEPEARIVFVDMSAGPNNADRQAFIEGDLKLIASGGRPLGLYDLAKDPGEKRDLLDGDEPKGTILPRFKAFRRSLKTVEVRR